MELARSGNHDATETLIKRFGYRVSDVQAVSFGLKRLRVLSVGAAKRIIASNADGD